MVGTRRLAALCCIFLASCSGDGGPTESFPSPSGEELNPAHRADSEFFNFTASRLGGGGQVTGAELQGKDVALWFWAPW